MVRITKDRKTKYKSLGISVILFIGILQRTDLSLIVLMEIIY